MITWTVTAEQATEPTATGRESSRGCAADNAIAAALDYFAATAPTPGLGAHTIAATLTVGKTQVIAGPGYDRCGAYTAEATAAGLQQVRDHLAAEAPATVT